MKGIHQAISAGAKFESQILSSMDRTISIDGQDEINLIDFIHDNTDPGVEPLSFNFIARICMMEDYFQACKSIGYRPNQAITDFIEKTQRY